MNILVPVLTGLAAVGVGFIAVIQIPAMQDLVSRKAVDVLGFDDNELTTEEQLAKDRQALSELQAQLSWKKTCAVRNIDDLKCESLWKEQQALSEAKRELQLQQAAVDEKRRLEAEQEAAFVAKAAAEEAALQQQIAQQQEALRQQTLAEQKAAKLAYQKDLATPKAGYTEIKSGTLNVGSASSVTIHNVLPNNCNGANWCNNVTINNVFVDGIKMKWHGAADHWNLMAEDSYSKMFYGVTNTSGTIRVVGHFEQQMIFAEYKVTR